MRSILIPVLMFAAILSARAAAQTSAQPDGTVPSVLAPRMPDALPPPGPVDPETNGPPPVSDRGTLSAVPLPPPDAEPPRPPPPEPATAAAAPVTGAPVSLAPPRVAAPRSGLAPLPPANSKQGANISPAALIANNLPTPALSPEATPVDFLRAARGALAAGRSGEARSALEMAQTRLLDRVVDAGTEQEPSHDTAVRQISDALTALGANDRMACLRYIEFASQTLGSPLGTPLE